MAHTLDTKGELHLTTLLQIDSIKEARFLVAVGVVATIKGGGGIILFWIHDGTIAHGHVNVVRNAVVCVAVDRIARSGTDRAVPISITPGLPKLASIILSNSNKDVLAGDALNGAIGSPQRCDLRFVAAGNVIGTFLAHLVLSPFSGK